MNAFFDFFASILSFFYGLVHSYAFAITMLTLLVMIIVTPLTLKGTRSMMVMQQLQPEIRKIQQQYKDDRQRLNEELLKFYKENNLNPLGGCLPLLVQMPVFLVLYQVLRGLTRRESSFGFDAGWVTGQLGVGRTPGTTPVIERPFDPAFIRPDTEMYQALHGSTTMSGPLGMNLAESASQALSTGIVHALPYLALIAIVGVTGFVQQRQIQGRNPNAQINPQQQMIMRIMPVFLPVISFGLPVGLVLYFAVSNLYRIGQQAFISRSIYGMSRAELKANREAGKKAAAAPAKKQSSPSKDEPGKTGGAGKSAKQETAKAAKRPASRNAGASRVTPKATGGTGQRALQPRARKKKR
ncbi:YidC/Oxa1 family membrane protein insertase [Rhabdothermincola sediminis]|uniref:YidC/Oxa1 family membrane protein insertase n=1 Tax=Rhabdothermincola sediminis TaxID=2751370 RepID=UPI001AA086D4|nr:YidC/Oxa1 family membrane protein insertase [Rhabdothermincola sediminis]